jgi:hypothetical protein
MTWQERFDRLLRAMSQGEPHKAEKRQKPQNEKGEHEAPQTASLRKAGTSEEGR